MRLLSLFLIFISQWIFSASDEGNITVNGETVEVSVERIYSPAADYPRSALRRGTAVSYTHLTLPTTHDV